ncbi:MAG: cytochrome c biogenesis protein CcsA [Candidatus Methanoperedens sp.]|jgi:cytochrome c-type biogenesis protein CcmF|nr:cytochrome c biogenesis protein CcsA [Candidatus Methanoperedens sp.]PKL54149.1 MAG: hypothetical protein CVV36_03310 [Candidatus Methanoperedenaceae archaeon HGW-Methanoperedenaceae-1]
MMIGSVLLYLSILFGLLSVYSLVGRELRESGKNVLFGKLVSQTKNLIRLTALFFSASCLLLIYYLSVSDFSIHYVWQYTSLDLPLVYKMSAFWTGDIGSFMFLAWVLVLVVLWLSERHGQESAFMRRIQLIILPVGLFFLLIATFLSPFTTSIDAGMDGIPEDGAGLNPLLVNKWMIFHPPGIFIPYGIMAVAFAAGIIHLLAGEKDWERFSRPYTRLAWILLGAGIVTGTMWSYEVWENYWIWDPAFTSILMTWLLFTAYMHASGMYRSRRMESLSPALAVNSFILAMYSTYIIRSGSIQSPHTFAEGFQTMPLIIFIVLLFVMAEGVVLYRYFKAHKETKSKHSDSTSLLSTINTFYATIILLAGLSFILFWGLTTSVLFDYIKAIISVDFYGTWSYPLSAALLAVLGICMIENTGKKWVRNIAVGAVLVLVIFLLKPADDITTNFSVSLLAFAGITSVYRILRSLNVSGMKNKLRASCPHIVHLGIAVMLVGVLMSATAVDETMLFMKFGDKKTVADYEIEIIDLSFPVSHKHATAVLSKIGTYNIYKDGKLVYSGDARFREIKGEFITEPLIYRGLLADVNVRYQGIGTMTPIFISVANVRVVPGMTIMWLGSILIVIGILPLLLLDRKN